MFSGFKSLREAIQISHHGDDEPINIEIGISKNATLFENELKVWTD